MAQHKGEPAASHRAFATVAPQTSRQQHDKALSKAWVLPTAGTRAFATVALKTSHRHLYNSHAKTDRFNKTGLVTHGMLGIALHKTTTR